MTQRTVVWQEKSRYALVTCFNNGHGVIVEKAIAPGRVTSEKDAIWVNQTSMHFRQRLHELGVFLAEPYTFEETDGSAIQTSPYVGLSLNRVFNKGEVTARTLEELILTMSGVLSQTEREVGIDARLSNFCLGPDERVFYVDTFPPLVKYRGEFIVHFPNPNDPAIVEQELQRKFDPLGIMRRLRFSILLEDAGVAETDILAAVKKVMGKSFYRKVSEYFGTLPDNKKIEEALAELTLDDPDAVRELALRFMPPRGEKRDAFFETIFDLSSNFCPLPITTDERLGRIRDLFAQNHQGE